MKLYFLPSISQRSKVNLKALDFFVMENLSQLVAEWVHDKFEIVHLI